MQTYLVIGNQTLTSEPLVDAVKAAMDAGECQFHIVVPATAPHEIHNWTEGSARAAAQRQLDAALERLAATGADVTGEVGDASPVNAARDAMLRGRYDAIILSTFPPGISRWLRRDVEHRLAHACGLPISHVVTEPAIAR
jgi:hypothetical protein